MKERRIGRAIEWDNGEGDRGKFQKVLRIEQALCSTLVGNGICTAEFGMMSANYFIRFKGQLGYFLLAHSASVEKRDMSGYYLFNVYY